MELSVLNIAGQETGRKIVLDDAIFGIQPNEHAIYLDVKQFLANNRQGTHKSKQRNEISGSTKKLKKQKRKQRKKPEKKPKRKRRKQRKRLERKPKRKRRRQKKRQKRQRSSVLRNVRQLWILRCSLREIRMFTVEQA